VTAKDDTLLLIHIGEAIERILTYTREGRQDFIASSLKQDAVIRNFEIIGEAVNRLASETTEPLPEVPWRRLAGFRDILIHRYPEVRTEEVWQVVEDTLPDLRGKIITLLATRGVEMSDRSAP
jgi:uncharacterized protein with HEPN domain